MGIHLLAEAKGWLAAALLALLGLRSDHIEPRPQFVISYVGSWPKSQDPVFARFLESLRSRHPDLLLKASLRHFNAPAGDDAVPEQVIRQALAEHPDVLVTPTGRTAGIAIRLAGPVPVVFATSTDPVRTGIRRSLQHAETANTGVSLADWLDEKRLEILHDAFPQAREVAVLSEQPWTELYDAKARLARASAALGLHTTLLYAETPEEVDTLMRSPQAQRFDAWYIPPTYVAYVASDKIIDHLRRMGKPAMHSALADVDRGALMAYQHDTSFTMDALTDLVARICAGEFAGAIPVQTPQRYLLALRTDSPGAALRIAPSVVRRADRVR